MHQVGRLGTRVRRYTHSYHEQVMKASERGGKRPKVRMRRTRCKQGERIFCFFFVFRSYLKYLLNKVQYNKVAQLVL